MLTKKNIITTLKAQSDILKVHFHVQKMGLFGSFSTGSQTADSDIDFIVTLDNTTHDIFSTKKALRHYLQQLFGRHVDIADYGYLKPYARASILNEVEDIV